MKKISEALDILKQLKVPDKQQNERSALVLLSLVSLKPTGAWQNAKKRFIRVHDMLKFISKNYRKTYAENSRETFRRQTLHQFEKEMGMVERNADNPQRATNSPNTVWSISDAALEVIKHYKTSEWNKQLAKFIKYSKQRIQSYKKRKSENEMSIIIDSEELRFSPGKHNELQIQILSQFKGYFCKSADVIYVGDASEKMLFLNENILARLKFKIEKHNILPDIILFDKRENRLYLIEAVTSHGPISNKRMIELNEYFSSLKCKKVFVSAFPDLKEFKRHIDEIAWETEVWVSEIPNHMIHFNGDKFLRNKIEYLCFSLQTPSSQSLHLSQSHSFRGLLSLCPCLSGVLYLQPCADAV